MNNFFKTFFAALLAMIVFVGLMMLIGVISIAAISSSNDVKTGKKAVLMLDLSKHYAEIEPSDAMASLTGADKSAPPALYNLLRLIKHAKNDESVKGIYIKCEGNDNDFAASSELRDALIDFSKSRKFIYAYGNVISQKAYYIASTADRIYCAPTGGIEWNGFVMTMPFIKGTLEKLDIQPQIFYAGKFKSATEPLRETQMTEANRLQSTELLFDIYNHFLSDIATSRRMDTAKLKALADSNAVQFASDALSNKMVDGLRYDDEVKDEMRKKLNIEKDDKINFITPAKYAQAVDYLLSGSDKIAVIYAEGNIVDGKAERDAIGGETYRNYIRRARMDKSIKAIVLRINSGGGSSSASEEIWREVLLAKKVKPVMVSFGGVAASGGYYIACAADSIFAESNTITGSIGVFGVIPNMESFFNNKLGVTFDDVSTTPDAGYMTVTKPLSPVQKRYIQNAIDTVYRDFKIRVADGRKKSMDYVDSIAQGRVWSGTRALQLGLVDRIGGIQMAIDAAASRAKITDYRLKEYPGKQTFFELFFDNKSESEKETAIKKELGDDLYKTYTTIRDIKNLVGKVQAKLPFDIIID